MSEESNECPICYDEMVPARTVTTECNHSFCIFCIVKVAKEQLSFTCPYCNRKILTKRLKLNGIETRPKLHSPFGQAYTLRIDGELGVGSFHFIDEEDIYISYDSDYSRNHWTVWNNNAPVKKPFVDIVYQKETRRFKGTILWDEDRFLEQCKWWTYDFVFSEDFLQIESGKCEMVADSGRIMHGSKFVTENQPEQAQLYLCYILTDDHGLKDILASAVKDMCFSCFRNNELIALPCHHTLCKSCVLTPSGAWSKECRVCQKIYFYSDLQIPQVNHKALVSPFGQVYAQKLGVGVASYHFNEEQPYISYENAPEEWKLDDGNKPPAKKEFTNWNYDKDARKFSGEIRWEPVTFKMDNLWVYELVFNEKFTEIEGVCKSYSPQYEEGHFASTKISSQGHSSLHYILQERLEQNNQVDMKD